MSLFRILAIATVCAVLSACAGYTAYEDARRMMMRGDTDAALAKLQQAVREAPNNASYRAEYERERAILVSKNLSEGDTARTAGRLDQAELLYLKALKLDPGNARAEAGLKVVGQLREIQLTVRQAKTDIEAGQLNDAEVKLRRALAQEPGMREARELMAVIAGLRSEALGKGQDMPPGIKSPYAKPITLEFRDATLKSVFEVISRTSGINFIFDRDVRADTKINIFVRNTTLDDVIKLILLTNQLERKVLNENSVLVYPNTPAKQKEYRELVMRSFYLANADVKQALNLVKGMIKSQDVFIDEKANLLVVKDTPEAMRVVQQLVRSLDIAEPEVVLEVEILELASNVLDQIGVQYPQTVNIGSPAAAAAGAAGAPGNFVLGTDTLKGYVVNPPIILDIKATDADAKVLANPSIRVKNHEKAKVHIGSKVPVITTTSTANVGVSSSVSYLDVGLKLDVEPTIYLRDQVAIKVGLDITNIISQVNVSGTIAYQLGTRSTATTLQLRDGETQILAGLISDADRESVNKFPGLGDVPVIGRLFSSHGTDRQKTEIVMLITPRIVRTLDWVQVTLADLPVGTDASIGSAPVRINATAPGSLTMAPSGTQPGVAPLPRQQVNPAAPPVEQAPPQPGAGGPPGAQNQAAIAPPPPNSGGAILLLSAPLAARAGTEIIVSLSLAPGGGAVRATADIGYDPQSLEPVGAPTSSPGRLGLRIEGSAAVRFKVLTTAGRAQVRVDNVVGVDPAGTTVPVQGPGPVDIAITP